MDSGDYFEKPDESSPKITVHEIRDRFVAAGMACHIEPDDMRLRIVFEKRKSFLSFIVDEFDHPSMASMSENADCDAAFAQKVSNVFDSIGWKLR